MNRRTPIFIICSSRPRVGKTLLARMMVEYFRSEERPVAAYDVNPDDYALVDYLPGYTAVASVADTRDQITLFDQVLAPDRRPKVLDVGHTSFDRFFTVIQEIGFAEEARRRGSTPVVLFLGDADRRSRQGYATLWDRFPDLPIVPVINEVLPQSIRFRDDFPSAPGGDPQITIPALSAVIKGVIERPSFSFSALAATAADTTTELYGWTRKVFLEFRELELRLVLAELRPALRFSA
jgi:hypothetical protein